MSIKLIVDDRERFVIQYFKESYSNLEIEVKRIQIGDYVITKDDKIIFVIERKTWMDLSSSIKDGRKKNVDKLINLRNETGCKIIYLMEGKSRFLSNKKIARIPFKNLQAHLDHLIIRDNIFIIHSSSLEDTALRLVEFITNYLSIPSALEDNEPNIENLEIETNIENPEIETNIENPEIETNDIQGGNHLNMLTDIVHKTDLTINYEIWNCVQNITDKTAKLFIDKNYHISDLILKKISKDEIQTMKYSNGTVIGKRAAKIIKVQNINDSENIKKYSKMLACIKGLTIKTAEVILKEHKFDKILNGEITLDKIANIKKSENKIIGKKIAEQIIKFFVKL
jgi:ERCC4-type nuclease